MIINILIFARLLPKTSAKGLSKSRHLFIHRANNTTIWREVKHGMYSNGLYRFRLSLRIVTVCSLSYDRTVRGTCVIYGPLLSIFPHDLLIANRVFTVKPADGHNWFYWTKLITWRAAMTAQVTAQALWGSHLAAQEKGRGGWGRGTVRDITPTSSAEICTAPADASKLQPIGGYCGGSGDQSERRRGFN